MNTPGIILAGTHSGVGKTTLTMGILQALSRSMKVQSFKVGPDYIDPAFHSFITGNPCRNLDSWMLDEKTLRYLFMESGQSADFCLVEGVMGLYDGKGATGDLASTAHLARILNLPVVLVIDGGGMSASAAAMVLGYKNYDPRVNLCGVIANNMGGEKHYQLIKEAVERDTGTKMVGYLPKADSLVLPSRHLGLVPSCETGGLRELLEKLADMVRETIDLESLTALAKSYSPGFAQPSLSVPEGKENVTIAVAKDRAFNFYYQDGLDLLEKMGARLSFFSPLDDRSLPDGIDGMLLGGGFPEVFASELEDNLPLRTEIGAIIEDGLPVYGECGGLMYLSQGIVDGDGSLKKMVGAFQGRVRLTKRLQRFGYVDVELQSDNVLGMKGTRYRAHEFHYSVLEDGTENDFSLLVGKGKNGDATASWECGIKKKQMLASYPHLHFYSNPALANHFLDRCRGYKQRRIKK